MASETARDQFLSLLRESVDKGELAKLTLARPEGGDPTLRNLFVRPVVLAKGPQLCLVWRHQTRDITKNLPPAEAIELLSQLIGPGFRDAHLFTRTQSIEFRCTPGGRDRLLVRAAAPEAPKADTSHDRRKQHLIEGESAWLQALGITNARGEPRQEMASKLRQIQKFAELLSHLLEEAKLGGEERPLEIFDMGCGKGYLTFAVAALLGPRARVSGIELRQPLVDSCNAIAGKCQLTNLHFAAGSIQDCIMPQADVVIALHACDTATDDAIARGLKAGARLLVLAPCCQKELRPQLTAPDVLADALRHGIFQERHAEFITDALRAELLEWAGYQTKVFEFISTEHTAKNTLIAAVKVRDTRDEARAARIRAFAAFYGIRHHHLATLLGFTL